VWAEKTGLVEPEDLSEREQIQAGNIFEKPIFDWWVERTGHKAEMWPRHQSVSHVEHPWMRCTPDAGGLDDLRGVNIQIKNSDTFMRKEWADGPPLVYVVQVQHEMAVLNAERTILVVCFGGNRLKWYKVDRNDRLIDAMIPKLAEFWELVKTKTPPPIDGSEATLETIKRLHPDDDGSVIDLSDKEAEKWAENLETSKSNIKEHKAMEGLAKTNLLSLIGGSTFATVFDATFSLKTQTREKPICPHCGERTGPPSTFRVLRAGVKIPDDAVYIDPEQKDESNE
jgi:predicted phage-related endonuclease